MIQICYILKTLCIPSIEAMNEWMVLQKTCLVLLCIYFTLSFLPSSIIPLFSFIFLLVDSDKLQSSLELCCLLSGLGNNQLGKLWVIFINCLKGAHYPHTCTYSIHTQANYLFCFGVSLFLWAVQYMIMISELMRARIINVVTNNLIYSLKYSLLL